MAKSNIRKILFIIKILLTYHAQCRTNLKLINLQCKSLDPEVGDFEKCILKAIKRDITELSIKFHLLKAINNASISLKLVKRGDVPTKSILYYRVDLCKFLSNKRRNPLAEMFFNIFALQKYSNLNHTCPINHDVIIDRCRLDTTLFNMLSFEKDTYTIITNWAVNRKESANVNISLLVY